MTTNNLLNFGTGTTGQLLTSNGAGAAPTFQASANINKITMQVFTASGTYTPTTGMKYIIAEIWGAGGGGGGVAGSATLNGAGGPGASGGYSRDVFSSSDIGGSQTVTIGTGGAAGTSAGGNGGNGTGTSLGALISTNTSFGGTGVSSPAASGTTNGGNGGAGSGHVNLTGQRIGQGVYTSTYAESAAGGGAGFTGSGGAWNQLVAAGSIAGKDAVSYGGGGSGAVMIATNTGHVGGKGHDGLMVITEFLAV